MFPVFDLDPVVASAWPVDALTMLGDQALKPHPAGSLEQLGTDLTLFEGRHEDALGSPAEQLRHLVSPWPASTHRRTELESQNSRSGSNSCTPIGRPVKRYRLGHLMPFSDPLLRFMRHVLGGITRPALQRIESHHVQGMVVLSRKEVADQSPVIGPVLVRLPPCRSAAKILSGGR
jgi:hypothetical protein